jgi:hypothetical protein
MKAAKNCCYMKVTNDKYRLIFYKSCDNIIIELELSQLI